MGSALNVSSVKLLLALACTTGLVSLDIACGFLLAAKQALPLRLAWADALLAEPHQVKTSHCCSGSVFTSLAHL